MRISDWSSDVCSSDLQEEIGRARQHAPRAVVDRRLGQVAQVCLPRDHAVEQLRGIDERWPAAVQHLGDGERVGGDRLLVLVQVGSGDRTGVLDGGGNPFRSEEHTSELQSLMRISYAVFCLKKKNKKENNHQTTTTYSLHTMHALSF